MTSNRKHDMLSNKHQKNDLTNNFAESCSKMFSLFSNNELTEVGNYHIINLIGKGSFGKVYLAYHKFTHTKVVLKTGSKNDPNVVREVMFHKTLHYKHITKLFEVIVTENTVWMVLEYCPGNELYEHLIKMGRIPLKETIKLFSQICSAVYYTHSMRLVHRDLKLENVLLDKFGNAKLTDFGFTRDCSTKSFLETICGTTVYMAPELIERKLHYDGYKIDVWALGIILYTMLAGFMPFDDIDEMKTKWQILNNEPDYSILVKNYNINEEKSSSNISQLKNNTSHNQVENFDLNIDSTNAEKIGKDDKNESIVLFDENCKDLLSKLLNKDPYKRPTLKQVLQHPFLKDYGSLFIDQVDITISQQHSLKPFQSKFQMKLLKKLKKTGFDVHGIKNSVIKQKCDPLYGLWQIMLYREIEKNNKDTISTSRLRRIPSRSRSVLSVRNIFSDSQQNDNADTQSLKFLKRNSTVKKANDKTVENSVSRRSSDNLSVKKLNTQQTTKTNSSNGHLPNNKNNTLGDGHTIFSTKSNISIKSSNFIQKFTHLSIFKKLETLKKKTQKSESTSRKRIRGDSSSMDSIGSQKFPIDNQDINSTSKVQRNPAYVNGTNQVPTSQKPDLKKQKYSGENINSSDVMEKLPLSTQVTFTDSPTTKSPHMSAYSVRQSLSDVASAQNNYSGNSISRPSSPVSEVSNTTFTSTEYSTDGERSFRGRLPTNIGLPSPKTLITQPIHTPTPGSVSKFPEINTSNLQNRTFSSPLTGAASRRLLRRSFSNISATSSMSDLSSRHDSFYEINGGQTPISHLSKNQDGLLSKDTFISNSLVNHEKNTKLQPSMYPTRQFTKPENGTNDKVPWFLKRGKSPIEIRTRVGKSRQKQPISESSHLGIISIQEEESSSIADKSIEEADVEVDDGYDADDDDNHEDADNIQNTSLNTPGSYIGSGDVKPDINNIPDVLAHPIPTMRSPTLSAEKSKTINSSDILSLDNIRLHTDKSWSRYTQDSSKSAQPQPPSNRNDDRASDVASNYSQSLINV